MLSAWFGLRDVSRTHRSLDSPPYLSDPALTPFILEVRDVMILPIECRFLPNKGWRRVTTRECLALLEWAGVFDRL